MKVTIPRSVLNEALSSASRAVATATSLPILKNVLICPDGTAIRVSATDLELGIAKDAGATITEGGGAVCVPAKSLLELVKALPEGDVTLADDEGHHYLVVSAGRSEYKLATLPAEDFPSLPEIPVGAVELKIAGAVLGKAIQRAVVACSKDETRPILTALALFGTDAGGLRLVATDTHRLHVIPLPVEPVEPVEGGVPVVAALIPADAAVEIARNCTEAEITLRIDTNQVEAVGGAPRTRIVSRLIEGQFPRYERVVPSSSNRFITAPKDDLIAILRRARIVAREAAAADRVILAAEGTTLTITAQAGELGEAREEIEILLEGEPITFGVNAAYLITACESLTGEAVKIGASDALAPLLLTGEDAARIIIMPMCLT